MILLVWHGDEKDIAKLDNILLSVQFIKYVDLFKLYNINKERKNYLLKNKFQICNDIKNKNLIKTIKTKKENHDTKTFNILKIK